MENDIRHILTTFRHIAVVGLSPKPERPSNAVARYLLGNGYEIYPVNPGHRELLGRTCYPSLRDMPEEIASKIEVVDIFRRPTDIPTIVDQAIALGARAVWMQLGITHEEAARKARQAGLLVVQNRCISVEHMQLAD